MLNPMTNIEFAQAWTRKLEALGIVDAARIPEPKMELHIPHDNQPLHPHPRRGRKRVYTSDYERLRAYRRRKSRMITK